MKLSLKNSAKTGLKLITLITSLVSSGCNFSTSASYQKDNIEKAIVDICKKDYKADVSAKLIGKTLWVYFPVEDILLNKNTEKPQKYIERFIIEKDTGKIDNGAMVFEFLVKLVPEKNLYQAIPYNKEVFKKINLVWNAIRRVLFSLEKNKNYEPQIICLITADIKKGFEIKNIVYYQDLKKLSYRLISVEEYQHRAIQEINVDPAIIGDKDGQHIEYKDITFPDFLISQIVQRIRLKFQKPEVERNADVDEEIRKIVISTVQLYNFQEFDTIELKNLSSEQVIILKQWQDEFKKTN